MKKVRFECEYFPTDKKKIKRSTTPCSRLDVRYYNQEKAIRVAKRIHSEIMNTNLFKKRLFNELLVENLLIKHHIYSKINKIYRLTDNSLNILKFKLLQKK
jgi:hypothetical protein